MSLSVGGCTTTVGVAGGAAEAPHPMGSRFAVGGAPLPLYYIFRLPAHPSSPPPSAGKRQVMACDMDQTVLNAIFQGRRKHGNEIPWQCSGRSSGELSGPFCLETPHFHVWCPQILRNGSRELSLEHCHSHAFFVPESWQTYDLLFLFF